MTEHLMINPETPPVIRRMMESGDFARLSGEATSVFMVLWTFAQERKYPSIEEIAEMAGLTKSQVSESLNTLEITGYVRRAYIPIEA